MAVVAIPAAAPAPRLDVQSQPSVGTPAPTSDPSIGVLLVTVALAWALAFLVVLVVFGRP